MVRTCNLIDASPIESLIEPLTLEEIKIYLQLPELSPADDTEDDLLETFIITAREVAEGYQNIDLVQKHWRQVQDCFPWNEIELRGPLVSVDRFRYRDNDGDWNTLEEGTHYLVDTEKRPGLVMPYPGTSWPSADLWPSSAVQIEFTSGYAIDDIFWGSKGQRILKGMKFLISHWYNNRLPVEHMTGKPTDVPWTAEHLLSFGASPRSSQV